MTRTSEALAAVVRPARPSDVDALVSLSKLTGGGMTNLPNDRDAIAEKIDWSCRSLDRHGAPERGEMYLLVLEDRDSGQVVGTGSILARLGTPWPFYSYRVVGLTHSSRELGRSISTPMLQLNNDFDGCSEVGGLFLHPAARASGMGRLMARSRYMFIAQHRERFADTLVAELRGHTVEGISPFWEAVGRHFFGSDFLEADHHNALHGNQFIIDLMPRHPIYIPLLPVAAQHVIGRPHASSAPAKRLLEKEGFRDDGYVDIFDAGPTLSVPTDHVRTICDSGTAGRAPRGAALPRPAALLMAAGLGTAFRSWVGPAAVSGDGLVLHESDPGNDDATGLDSLAVRHVAF